VAYVAPLLKRKEAGVRELAADALAELGDEEAKKALGDALKRERSERARDRMKRALVKIDPSRQTTPAEQKRSPWRFW
jgi:HEAT repeat protein